MIVVKFMRIAKCCITPIVKVLLPLFWLIDKMIKFLGILLICVTFGLVLFNYTSLLLFGIPHLSLPLPLFLLVVAVVTFGMINLFYNYIMCIITDGGEPPLLPAYHTRGDADLEVGDIDPVSIGAIDTIGKMDTVKNEEEMSLTHTDIYTHTQHTHTHKYTHTTDDEMELGERRTNWKMCLKCNHWKPPRTHHCSMCNRCVLRMDHHCPWVNQCVGFHNHRYFCLFIGWLVFVSILTVAFMLPEFVSLYILETINSKNYFERNMVGFTFVITISVLFSSIMMSGFHAYLVLSNQTTIEFQENARLKVLSRRQGEIFRNEYDLGTTRNFRSVFGVSRLWWFPWLSSVKPPEGNGMSFQKLGGRI
eukprot:GHVR01110241.1.p1 GENE.GHVR01110241.1~~GHVR01110241.1.p1  ORF type:complete len:363 (+),score=68.29 GHVR01110241.1:196-1284(+)